MNEAIVAVAVMAVVCMALVSVGAYRAGRAVGWREMDARWSKRVSPLECVFEGGPADGKTVTLNALGCSVAVPFVRHPTIEMVDDYHVHRDHVPDIGNAMYRLHGVLRCEVAA